MARDDFPTSIKSILAQRVGMQCSNPNCRQVTSGPSDEQSKYTNVGVAAHVTAASSGGPRFDDTLSPEDRKSIDNAIWLCQNCAKLVDGDPRTYTTDTLRQWRKLSEQAARLAIESPSSKLPESFDSDIQLVRFFVQCFDRPVFQDHFHQEGSMEAFDRAIEDTITAINTGCLLSRDGAVLSRARGKAFLQNLSWRQKMDVIVDLLRAIRSRYDEAVRRDDIHVSERRDGGSFYYFRDPDIAEWMDSTRCQVLAVFNSICEEAGVHPPRAWPSSPPRRRWRPS